MSDRRIQTGRIAENAAAALIEDRGGRVIERNARIRYAESEIAGEIDIISLDRGVLVFTEVKAGRVGARRGPERPAMMVGPAKQLRLRRLARAWIAANAAVPRFTGVRFDVIEVLVDGRSTRLNRIEQAF